MRIDFDKPHSKYCGGIPAGAPKGTVYRQGDDYFSGKGDLIPKPEITPSTAGGYVPTTQTAIDDQSITQEVPLESRHWKQIKQVVEKVGGEFTTKAEGIKYLREREDVNGVSFIRERESG